jgi:tryptophan halogenase
VQGTVFDKVIASPGDSSVKPDLDIQAPRACAGTKPGAVERAGRLLARLQAERLEGFEKSVKMSSGRLLGNRFLAGIPVARMGPEKLHAICTELDMPGDFLKRLMDEFAGADTVHFGFEEGSSGGIFKVYLEFWKRLNRAIDAQDETVLLHQAFKWDALDNSRRAVANYCCYPRLSREQTLLRIAGIYHGDTGHPSFRLVQQLVKLGATRTNNALMYLEVGEEGNLRASFDLNFHAAGIRLRDIEPQFIEMSRHYSLPASEFARLWSGIWPNILGHLSGGLSRDGEDFLTVYYAPAA